MKHKTIVEETIDSIDNIKKAEISPYFKTRMNALFNNQSEMDNVSGFQPIILMAFTVLLLLINTLLVSKSSTKDSSNYQNNSTSLQQFSDDYHINNASNFYYDDKQ
jgi:hypothetical protein